MVNQMHWLPLLLAFSLKLLSLVPKSKLGIAPKYLRDHIRFPLSRASHRPLRSLDRHFSLFHELGPLWPKLDHSPPFGPPYGMSFPPLYILPVFLDLFLHLSPCLKLFSSLWVLAVGAPLNGHLCEQHYTSHKLQYNAITVE